jgi:hypothetical protein
MLVGLGIAQVAERFQKRRHGGIVGFWIAGVNEEVSLRIVWTGSGGRKLAMDKTLESRGRVATLQHGQKASLDSPQ